MSNQNDTVLCKECGQCINATTNWCTSCNAKHFESNFQNWTSDSVELDEFIRKTQRTAERHECVFEWVDYSKFTLLEKVEHSKNHRAYWKEGPLLGWDTKLNEWSRNGGQWVKLITNFCGEKYYASRFLKSVKMLFVFYLFLFLIWYYLVSMNNNANYRSFYPLI